MASVSFVLKEPNSKEETLVYLIFRFNNQRLKYSTGEKINPIFWNATSQKARETRQFPGYVQFNTLLKRLEGLVFDVYRRFLNDEVKPSQDQIREALNIALNKVEPTPKDNLLSFVESFIASSNKRPNTLKHYKQTLRQLEEYSRSTKKELKFENIDLEFYDDFINWLQKKDYGMNTIGGFIKNLKVFMNEAFDRKFTKSIDFKNRRFRTIEEPSESIYLTENEIQKIISLDLSKNSRLDKIRDLFVIGCYTGLRFSDLAQLKNLNFDDEKKMFKIKTEKTGEVVIIPINGIVKIIILKYSGIIPDVISNQKMNEYLKEIGELALLEDDIIIHSTKGGKRYRESFKKFELITVHTARRSFATNAYLNDVPTISIMKITGHKTEKSFLKYIKISQEDNANKLINHPFFK